MKDKVLKLYVPFDTKGATDEDEDLLITGHASTNDEDRSGDIIVSDAWKKSGALANYLKNPVVLAFHDMSRPIGRTISHEVDEKGLKVTAKISKAVGEVVTLIKEGILSAFSVGFTVKDADFDRESGVFIIKDLELYEISVVSIPANQNTLFSVSKNFSDQEEYNEFKKQFIKSEETLMVDKTKTDSRDESIDVAALAAQISSMVKGDLEAEKKEAEAKAAKEAAELARVEVTATTAAERLIKDLEKRLEEKDANLTAALEGIRDAVKSQAEEGEIEKALNSKTDNKMEYTGDSDTRFKELTQSEKDGMLYVSKIKGIPVHETKTFKDFVKKSNMEHWDAGVVGEWEDEYSTRVQNALRQVLVVEPIFTTIPMSTPTMNMPINPDAGDATWVHSAAYRSANALGDETTGTPNDVSSGAAVDHELNEQTLIAYKLATREYVGYEEEEDSIVALAPIINDAVTRRMALSSDLAHLRGGGVLTNTAAYDPILGLEGRGANTTDVAIAGGTGWAANFTENDVVDMRRNLNLYGLDPSQLTFICSHALYYEMLKFDNFKTLDVLGARATILTGEVGELFGVRVLVSQQFDNTAIDTGTVGTTLGIMCRQSNFIRGELRGIMTEGARDIVNQKRVIVSSRRFAFNDIITGEGTVNLEIAS